MKITLSTPEERKELRFILIDGEVWRSIHRSVFGRRPKFPSEFESLADWQAEFDKIELERARNYALRRLSVQNYYSGKLHQLLLDRCIQPHTAEKVISTYLEMGYLNDEAWLEAFMRGHVKRQSIKSIRYKLRSIGIPSDILSELLEKWKNPEEEKETVTKLLKTKYRHRNLADYKQKQKVIAALMRRGFNYELISSVLRSMN